MSRPEDHRRPKKRPNAYPLYAYPPAEAFKIFFKTYRTELASLSGGLLSQLTLYPLETIKTRMQAYNFPSVWACIQDIRRTEGLREGLYRGIASPTISYCFVRVVTFNWYQNIKYFLDDSIVAAGGQSFLALANTPYARPTLTNALCFGSCGAVVGFGISFLACPFELLKVGRQMSGTLHHTQKVSLDEALHQSYREKGTVSAGVELYRRVGFRGLYSGIHLHAIRDTVGTSLFFASYESLKQALSVTRGLEPDNPTAGGIAGGICGMFSYLCAHPIDTVKTMYQRNCLFTRGGSGPSVAINFLSRDQYRGLPITLVRVFISNLINMSMFELVKKNIRSLEVDPPPPPRRQSSDPL